MRGIKPSQKTLDYIELLYINQYPLSIISERTGMGERSIARYAKENGWIRELQPKTDVDDTLRDFQTTTGHVAARILAKATNQEFDEEYQSLASTARQLTFVTESLMKQAAYHPAKQAETFSQIATQLIRDHPAYSDDQKTLIVNALRGIQKDLVANVVNTLEKLT